MKRKRVNKNDLQRYKRVDPVGAEGVQAVYGDVQSGGVGHIYNRDIPLAKTSERAVCTGQDEAGQDCNMDEKQPPYKPQGVGYSLQRKQSV